VRKPWPWGADATDLITPLSVEDCLRLLRVGMDPSWKLFGRCPVVGRVRGTRFRARKRIRYSNSLQTLALGSLAAEPGRTRVACRFAVSPWAAAFIAFWFGFVGLLAVAMIGLATHLLLSERVSTRMLGYEAPVLGPVLAMAAAPVMLVLAYLLVRFGRRLARDERDYLLDFLCLTLNAHVAAAPSAALREREKVA
jgi:hypothetical protein